MSSSRAPVGLALASALWVATFAAAQEPSADDAKKDLARIKEMNAQLVTVPILQAFPERDDVKEFLANLLAFDEDVKRLETKYGRLLKGRNQPFRDLAGVLRHRREQLARFRTAASEYASAAAIEIEIAQAFRYADEAVTKGSALYFGPNGGVTQHLGWAKTKLAVLTALSPTSDETKDATAKLESARKKISEQQGALAEKIVAENQSPPDRYRGSDREALLGVLRDKWKKDGNDAEPLKVGIVGDAWKRRVSWEWRAQAWHKSDASRIQGFVLVKLNDKIAVRRAINLVKDHLAGDKIAAHFVDDPKQPPQLIDQILLAKVK